MQKDSAQTNISLKVIGGYYLCLTLYMAQLRSTFSRNKREEIIRTLGKQLHKSYSATVYKRDMLLLAIRTVRTYKFYLGFWVVFECSENVLTGQHK